MRDYPTLRLETN